MHDFITVKRRYQTQSLTRKSGELTVQEFSFPWLLIPECLHRWGRPVRVPSPDNRWVRLLTTSMIQNQSNDVLILTGIIILTQSGEFSAHEKLDKRIEAFQCFRVGSPASSRLLLIKSYALHETPPLPVDSPGAVWGAIVSSTGRSARRFRYSKRSLPLAELNSLYGLIWNMTLAVSTGPRKGEYMRYARNARRGPYSDHVWRQWNFHQISSLWVQRRVISVQGLSFLISFCTSYLEWAGLHTQDGEIIVMRFLCIFKQVQYAAGRVKISSTNSTTVCVWKVNQRIARLESAELWTENGHGNLALSAPILSWIPVTAV